MDKGTKKARKKAADMGLKGPYLEREGIIKKPTVKKPATTSSNKLSENHVVKFTSYLKENFHINELTEEEIAWIYENEYIRWLFGGGNSTNTGSGPQVPPRATIARKDRLEKQNQAVQKDKETAKGSEVAHNVPSASASFRSAQEVGMVPESQGKAQKEVKRVLSTPEAKKRKLERMVPKTSDAFAQDYDDEIDKPTPPTPTPPSRPAASARRETGSTDSDSSGPSSSQSFTSYRRSLGLGGSLKDAQSEPYKRAYGEYRKAKTPKKSFSQTAYEPGGVFDRD